MKPRKHGTQRYYIEGEGFVGRPESSLNKNLIENEERAFRFVRMLNLPQFSPSKEALEELGMAMEENPQSNDHPNLGAGFTYLGQFIDHDITRDQTAELPDSELDPEEIVQGRSPSMDLDSVYGRGPDLSPELYTSDGLKFRIGETTPSQFGGNLPAFPNDLPRDEERTAIIGDSRNDENLAVAQTHLAFLKFHNKVVDFVAESKGLKGSELFNAAKEIVVKHYQWIVLKDFVPRVVAPEILADVLSNGPQFFEVANGDLASMPIEFSVAAFRKGHSIIRDEYEWNSVFNSTGAGPIASLGLLFRFTGLSGNLGGDPTLPSNWIIDWTRFFDFSDFKSIENHPRSNTSRLIDTALANHLKNLPNMPAGPQSSLSVRNLIRGKMLGLPSGQAVADLFGVERLSSSQITSGTHATVLRKHGFDQETPLWYYILKEAEILHQGLHLGPVGSRILVETFVGLIRGSRISILSDPSWTPDLPSRLPADFQMTDLLVFVNDLNPIGDEVA